jgi:hypothetical protein
MNINGIGEEEQSIDFGMAYFERSKVFKIHWSPAFPDNSIYGFPGIFASNEINRGLDSIRVLIKAS